MLVRDVCLDDINIVKKMQSVTFIPKYLEI